MTTHKTPNRLVSAWRRFNEELAARIVLTVATMECVYAFGFFVLIPVFFPTAEPIVQYISSALLQLTFLPLIMVGQDVMGRKAEKQRQQDHAAIAEELKLLRKIAKHLGADHAA